ncbi:hypothetical protein GMOD_00006648 [Pyrenophora seminiperda CCB06]|uniref:Uncharacterized protein n=1 Tax=Pyrenophora seminiperda CCB06 TaxID=1302712 RepID=A0A3M7MAH7_9PLEO|nr:hypothetical protein GMOD_00006648 [Pyrenophora seminiperda CCB06]
MPSPLRRESASRDRSCSTHASHLLLLQPRAYQTPSCTVPLHTTQHSAVINSPIFPSHVYTCIYTN